MPKAAGGIKEGLGVGVWAKVGVMVRREGKVEEDVWAALAAFSSLLAMMLALASRPGGADDWVEVPLLRACWT